MIQPHRILVQEFKAGAVQQLGIHEAADQLIRRGSPASVLSAETRDRKPLDRVIGSGTCQTGFTALTALLENMPALGIDPIAAAAGPTRLDASRVNACAIYDGMVGADAPDSSVPQC